MYKTIDNSLKKKLIEYRKKGLSLPELSNLFGIPKTTIFRYIKDVKIRPGNIALWKLKWGGSQKRKKRLENEAKHFAFEKIRSLTLKEKLILLSSLYWAEGNKKDLILTNTDVSLIQTFIICLNDVLGITCSNLKISIRIFEDLNAKKCIEYWENSLRLPKGHITSVNILKGKKSGKLNYGMCRVRYPKGGIVLKKIKAVNNRITNILVPVAQMDRAEVS